MDETWDDYEDEGPHRHSRLELTLGHVFFRHHDVETPASAVVYMRFRTTPVLLAIACWLAVAGMSLFYFVADGALPLVTPAVLTVWAIGIANFWWFDYVRLDVSMIERSYLFGIIRHRRPIEALLEVQSRPVHIPGYAWRRPSICFVFTDLRFEVMTGSYHWVDGRRLIRRLHERGVPIARKLVQHYELAEYAHMASTSRT